MNGLTSAAADAPSAASQEIFESCYRGRQSRLHHLAYLRTGKVFLILRMLERAKLSLESKDVFDYGFGAGTFFHYCPRETHLFGVEIDAENVSAVESSLRARGYPQVDLQRIVVERWAEHPLLSREYDLIVCSHVLEHLDDPVTLLGRFRECLRPRGAIVALLPLNERVANPHHVTKVERDIANGWARAADLQLIDYLEDDPWFYWTQPFYTVDRGPKHALARVVSLGTGLLAQAFGPRRWIGASRIFAALSRSKPTQAALLLRRA